MVRVHIDRQLRGREGENPEIDDAGIGAVGRLLDGVVEGIGRAVEQLRPDRRSGLAQPLQLRVDQVPFERRDDDDVHEQERPGHNQGEREAEPAPDAAKRVHRSRKR